MFGPCLFGVYWLVMCEGRTFILVAMIPDVQLSKRERDVLKLVLQGKSNKQIALSLAISVRTVKFHLKNVYAKFQVSSRIELLLKLGPATGAAKIDELGYSTVDRQGANKEKGNR